VAHNGLDYDHRALWKVRGRGPTREQTVDTMVLGRLFEPERSGGHSLDSYGETFGIKKSEFSEYHQWSQELQDRCVIDVQITLRLWKKFAAMIPEWGQSVALEHEVAWLILVMRENGITLNERKATTLAAELSDEQMKLQVELQKVFPPIWLATEEFTPKRDLIPRKDKTKPGYYEGAKFTRIELQEFNPAARCRSLRASRRSTGGSRRSSPTAARQRWTKTSSSPCRTPRRSCSRATCA
jgi:DNA polymerase-1